MPPSLSAFPQDLATYPAPPHGASVSEILIQRMHACPFNAAATAIFALAILHTFFAASIRHRAHLIEKRHGRDDPGILFRIEVLHFLGEIEVVFGLWSVALIAAISVWYDWGTAVGYLSHRVNFTEPMFVVAIMAMAATRPVLDFSTQCLGSVARIGRSTPVAWWASILILAPLLGSLITEPAAMTIAASLLAAKFYRHKPSPTLAYATIGLLFVNVSIGGTLTHFAAPPVLMVAAPWGWNTPYVFLHFGWKAAIAIVAATTLCFSLHRRELLAMRANDGSKGHERESQNPRRVVPAWIIGTHLAFLACTVLVAHHPVLFIGLLLFFIGFLQATAPFQKPFDLKAPLLVGFFLAGLVIHGGLQGWWIEPVLKSLGEHALFSVATVLTAFNDNAAITYLATLVPDFTDALKHAVVAGAVTGGGLTVIANAPNPAGQAILQKFFPGGVSPARLFLGALLPTLVASAAFLFL